jgi:hypothetical protein
MYLVLGLTSLWSNLVLGITESTHMIAHQELTLVANLKLVNKCAWKIE